MQTELISQSMVLNMVCVSDRPLSESDKRCRGDPFLGHEDTDLCFTESWQTNKYFQINRVIYADC